MVYQYRVGCGLDRTETLHIIIKKVVRLDTVKGLTATSPKYGVVDKMNQNLCYDNEAKYGQSAMDSENEKVFKRFPPSLKYFIESQHKLIYEKVKAMVIKEYGQNGLKYLVKSSGFRAPRLNTYIGGVFDSLHIWGCAIDFRKVGIFQSKPIPVCSALECIDSGTCWHIQLKRSKNG